MKVLATDARLKETKLTSVNLNCTKLYSVMVDSAILFGANFNGVKLDRADLSR